VTSGISLISAGLCSLQTTGDWLETETSNGDWLETETSTGDLLETSELIEDRLVTIANELTNSTLPCEQPNSVLFGSDSDRILFISCRILFTSWSKAAGSWTVTIFIRLQNVNTGETAGAATISEFIERWGEIWPLSSE